MRCVRAAQPGTGNIWMLLLKWRELKTNRCITWTCQDNTLKMSRVNKDRADCGSPEEGPTAKKCKCCYDRNNNIGVFPSELHRIADQLVDSNLAAMSSIAYLGINRPSSRATPLVPEITSK